MGNKNDSLGTWLTRIRALRRPSAQRKGLGDRYDRKRHLPRLLALAPWELEGIADGAIVRKLARALRQERQRGRAGHWTYDINRHLALKQAHAAEYALWRSSRRAPPRLGPRSQSCAAMSQTSRDKRDARP